MARIQELQVAIVDKERKLEEITEESVQLFLTSHAYNTPLYSMVREEFEAALMNDVRIDRRKKKQETTITSGSINFTITTTRTERTSYASALGAIKTYLESQLDAYEEGKRPQGIVSIKGEPHIRLDDIKEKTEQFIRDNTSNVFSNNIDYDEEPDYNTERVLRLRPGSYGTLTTRNARDYIAVRDQEKTLKRNIIDAFKNAAKQSTGYSRDNIPEQTMVCAEQVGDSIVCIVSAPREDIKYKAALEEFTQYLATCSDSDGAAPQKTSMRDGTAYIGLRTILEVHTQLIEENKGKTVQQDVYVMPLPVYDRVIAQ